MWLQSVVDKALRELGLFYLKNILPKLLHYVNCNLRKWNSLNVKKNYWGWAITDEDDKNWIIYFKSDGEMLPLTKWGLIKCCCRLLKSKTAAENNIKPKICKKKKRDFALEIGEEQMIIRLKNFTSGMIHLRSWESRDCRRVLKSN